MVPWVEKSGDWAGGYYNSHHYYRLIQTVVDSPIYTGQIKCMLFNTHWSKPAVLVMSVSLTSNNHVLACSVWV